MESAGHNYEDDKSVVVDGNIVTIKGIRDIILVCSQEINGLLIFNRKGLFTELDLTGLSIS